MCTHCIIENHSDHVKDKVNLVTFWNLVKSKFSDRFERLEEINKSIQGQNDKDLIQNFQDSLMEEIERIEKQVLLQIQKFKQQIPQFLPQINQLSRLSYLNQNFSEIRQTRLIKELFNPNFIQSINENKVREIIDCYYDQGYDKSVNNIIDELRNYQICLDQLKAEQEKNIKYIQDSGTQIQIQIDGILKQVGVILNDSLEKVLKYTTDRTREEFYSVNTSVIDYENEAISIQNQKRFQNKYKTDYDQYLNKENERVFKVHNPNLMQSRYDTINDQDLQYQQHLNINKKYLKKDKNGNLCLVCRHYVTNYIPIYKCCDKQYPCYICHDSNENHKHMAVKGALCLKCKNVSNDFTQCLNCQVKYYMIM